MKLSADNVLRFVEPAIYGRRGRSLCVAFLVVATLLLLVQAVQIRPDAAFEKAIPLEHPYMRVLKQYESQFGGGNTVLVALIRKNGDIYNGKFLGELETATNELFFIRGIDRSHLFSLFTRNVRYMEVVNGGFESGDVIPAEYAPTQEMLDLVRQNVGKADIIGRLVSKDQRGAMIAAEVLESDPVTGQRADYPRIAHDIEDRIRGRFASPTKYVYRLKRDRPPFAAGDVVAEDFHDPGWSRWFRRFEAVKQLPGGKFTRMEIGGRDVTIEAVANPQYDPDIAVHVIGFAKLVGDVTDASLGVLGFFALTVIGTMLALWWYLGSFRLALLPLLCSLVAVIWEFGLLRVFGYGIDPFAIMVPFLVLAISTSHGVQYVNTWADEVVHGRDGFGASRETFRRLFIPGTIALLTNVAGFMTIHLVPIETIREMSVNACLGMLAVIVTNKVMMPIWLSRLSMVDVAGFRAKRLSNLSAGEKLWRALSVVTEKPVAAALIACSALVLGASWWYQGRRIVGDAGTGVPELRPDSAYNRDSRAISDNFAIGTDILRIIAETGVEACSRYDVMDQIDEFAWRMQNVAGVASVRALPFFSRHSYSAWQELNPKFLVLPEQESVIGLTIRWVPTTSGLLNPDCSALPVFVFTSDHRATTVAHVVEAARRYNRANAQAFYQAHPGADPAYCAGKRTTTCPVNFALASGNVGVMAATNEVVTAKELPTVLWVYAVIVVLVILSYRSLAGLLAICIPLFMVSIFANALMALFGIGLKVATLPVVSLAVGIGVDYGIYIFDVLQHNVRDGRMPLHEAYLETLRKTGKAVIFTGVCLAGGVATWLFSGLQFQRDMGLLLVFMFGANMLGAILLGPAFCRFLMKTPNG